MKHTLPHIAGRPRARGVSLIEGVLYLVLALAIIVGGIVFFQQANFSRQVNATAGMMTSVSAQVIHSVDGNSQTRADSEFVAADASSWAVRSGSVASDMIDESGDAPMIRSPWGGIVTFAEAAAYVGSERVPVIAARLNDIPAGACMRLGHKNEGGDTAVGVDVLAIAVEDNYLETDDASWTSGSVLYQADPGERTDFEQLAVACEEDGRDLVVYYEVNGVPDTMPVIDYMADDGGFTDDGGDTGGDTGFDPDDPYGCAYDPFSPMCSGNNG